MGRLTITKVAEAFVEQRSDRYRYRPDRHEHGRRRWFIWDGAQWKRDDTLAIFYDARCFARDAGLHVTSSAVDAIVRRARASLSE